MNRLFPGLSRLSGYRGQDLVSDVVAGAILAVLLVPQAMAYAQLAGFPPETGLYTAIAPAFLYALFGTSNHVSVGPVALASILAGDAAARSGLPLMQAAEIVALETGIMLLCLGALGLGRLVNFVSEPVLLGFLAAIAILIGVSQLGALLGLEAERGLQLRHGFVDAVDLEVERRQTGASLVVVRVTRDPLLQVGDGVDALAE